jgi:hypothetical protein
MMNRKFVKKSFVAQSWYYLGIFQKKTTKKITGYVAFETRPRRMLRVFHTFQQTFQLPSSGFITFGGAFPSFALSIASEVKLWFIEKAVAT